LWDLEKNAVKTLMASEFLIQSLTYSPDGKILAYCGVGNVALLDSTSGKEIRNIRCGSDLVAGKLSFSSGGLILFAVGRRSAHIWSVRELLDKKK
jgi:WD40 repeat protein